MKVQRKDYILVALSDQCVNRIYTFIWDLDLQWPLVAHQPFMPGPQLPNPKTIK